jgi:hypothetical protein
MKAFFLQSLEVSWAKARVNPVEILLPQEEE